MKIHYLTTPISDIDQVIALYKMSFIENPRPLEDRSRVKAFLSNASILVSAWHDARLIGLCRSLSDFSYVTYVCDIAVHQDYQNQGVGKTLISMTQKESGHYCRLVLLSNTRANDYYPKLGFQSHPRAWELPGL